MLRIRIFIIFILLASILLGCGPGKPRQISLEKREVIKEESPLSKGEPIRLLIGVLVSPRETLGYYQKMAEYISVYIKKPVLLNHRKTFTEVLELVKAGEVDIVFLGGLPYVMAVDASAIELLVVPEIRGKTTYHSYLIVPSDSQVKTLEQLRGKSFGFSDPLSNSGKLITTYMLALIGETPESFFKEFVYTRAHDLTIKAVALGLVDGGAVDSLIWDYFDQKDPQFTSMTRIIKISAPYGVPPVGVRPGLNPQLKKEIRDLFLTMHKIKKGQEILQGIMVDRFIAGNDQNYDSIRQIRDFVDEFNRKQIQERH